MNNKNILPIAGLIVSVIVLLFGNNIYFQATGKSFFSPDNLMPISLAAVTITILIGLSIIFYRRSNAFVLDTTKNFISGAMTDGRWVHINGFIFYAQNKSKRPIVQVDGFLRSNITNQTYPVYLVDHNGHNIPPAETNGIPPRSRDIPIFAPFAFDENGNVNVNGGIDVNTLFSTLANTTLVLTLDGKVFQYHIPENKLRANIEAIRKNLYPSVPPSVTRKNNQSK